MHIDFCSCSGFDSFVKNGFDALGNQRWRCKYCGKAKPFNKLKKLCTNFAYRELTKKELYCLGFLVADGSVYNNRIQVQVQKDDVEVLHIIQNTFNTYGKISHILRKDGREARAISFRASYFQDDLYHLGLFPNKTSNEIWIPKYMENWDFVRGFIDGDGSFYFVRKEKFLKFAIASSENMLIGLSNFIHRELGCKERTLYPHGSIKMIRYASKDTLKICSKLYADSEGLRLERKYKKYKLMQRYHRYKKYILTKYPPERDSKGRFKIRENTRSTYQSLYEGKQMHK